MIGLEVRRRKAKGKGKRKSYHQLLYPVLNKEHKPLTAASVTRIHLMEQISPAYECGVSMRLLGAFEGGFRPVPFVVGDDPDNSSILF